MSKLDFDEFTWFSPHAKERLSITITNADSINLNPKLVVMMPERIEIGVRGCDTICIRPSENGYRVVKSGSIKAREAISFLIKNGGSFPAKYTVTAEENYWVATLEAKPMLSKIDPSKVSHKPRKGDLSKLLDKEGHK